MKMTNLRRPQKVIAVRMIRAYRMVVDIDFIAAEMNRIKVRTSQYPVTSDPPLSKARIEKTERKNTIDEQQCSIGGGSVPPKPIGPPSRSKHLKMGKNDSPKGTMALSSDIGANGSQVLPALPLPHGQNQQLTLKRLGHPLKVEYMPDTLCGQIRVGTRSLKTC